MNLTNDERLERSEKDLDVLKQLARSGKIIA